MSKHRVQYDENEHSQKDAVLDLGGSRGFFNASVSLLTQNMV